ncbi:DUF397 domain-containing protein [Streptomyces sp. NPDC014891]|uniref:DUF397 domain-containing protein n=1 Tax=Streptomyces sp. NPDC014891 TaxID=3364929 RepID=UPI0036FEB0C7
MSSTGALCWFRGGCSDGDGGDCIEVAARAGTVPVRDSEASGSPPRSSTTAACTRQPSALRRSPSSRTGKRRGARVSRTRRARAAAPAAPTKT